jgi:hypothetical protein
VYCLEAILSYLYGNYAAYPLAAPAINLVMPAIEFCFTDSGGSINGNVLGMIAAELHIELQAALVSLMGKAVFDISESISISGDLRRPQSCELRGAPCSQSCIW